ncbi:MAG: cupin domain-containing protein [Chloroflexota bacterium]
MMLVQAVEPVIYEDIEALIKDIPPESIVSRTILKTEYGNVTLFGFDAGQSLSEHTSTRPAIMHFLRGEATVTLDEQVVDARPGTWIHMAAGQKHGILARTTVVMLLLLFNATE